MGVWNTATPAGSDPKSQGDDRIRELKVAVEEALQADGGVFPGPSPLTAPVYYPVFQKAATGSKPAASADYPGRLFYDETNSELERVKDDGASWERLTNNPATRAIHAKVAQALASVAGVVTLPETANAFTVSGTEAVTSIAGWSAGIVRIQWSSSRILTHSASLYLEAALSRNVVAGDISTFMFNGADSCVEIAFHGALSGKEAGETFEWAGATLPAGALRADGTSYLRADYPRLFSRIGTIHGTADGTHFNVPDHEGRFARGMDNGAGRDPDAAGRTAANTGGATGDNVGSVQDDEFEAHTHTSGVVGGAGAQSASQAVIPANGNTGSAGGSTETRPKNACVMKCIKF